MGYRPHGGRRAELAQYKDSGGSPRSKGSAVGGPRGEGQGTEARARPGIAAERPGRPSEAARVLPRSPGRSAAGGCGDRHEAAGGGEAVQGGDRRLDRHRSGAGLGEDGGERGRNPQCEPDPDYRTRNSSSAVAGGAASGRGKLTEKEEA